jgi:hypothetical protein
MKVVRLSALRTGRLYPPENILGAHFLLEAESTPWTIVRPEGLSVKHSNDNIENRTRDLSACSAVPHPAAPLRAPV